MLRYIHSQWLQLSLPDTLSNSTTQDRRMEIEFSTGPAPGPALARVHILSFIQEELTAPATR